MLYFLVRSDSVCHRGFPELRSRARSHTAFKDSSHSLGRPVGERWAGDTDVGTKGIETSVNNNYSSACV